MGALYELIPNAPHPSMNPTPTPTIVSHVVDGVIGTFHAETHSKKDSHSNPNSTTPNIKNTPPQTPSPGKTFEVILVQYTPTSKNQNKKKRKGKSKEEKNNNKQSEKPKTQPIDEKDK
jgi:hypothetical protein